MSTKRHPFTPFLGRSWKHLSGWTVTALGAAAGFACSAENTSPIRLEVNVPQDEQSEPEQPGETNSPSVTAEPVELDELPVETRPAADHDIPPGCGDGELTEDEACDDGNTESGDGCASNCLATERGFSCASPGQACQAIARCGDGIVAVSEQCDDGNAADGDGCSSRCRIELGKKCEGEPSACTDAVCGDGVREGSEACDDGNDMPFDGCSPTCTREPNCEGVACTSECGDGFVLNEECDDGNRVDGDGCSSSCTIETGFVCAQNFTCERINDECVLKVPVIYRDFSDAHPDFGDHSCLGLVTEAVEARLDESGRPALGTNAALACIDSAESFAEWYVETSHSRVVVDELTLFGNGAGGFVNRFGAEGEQFVAIDPATERRAGASEQDCEASCVTHARNGQAPLFSEPLRCDDVCRPLANERSGLISGELSQLQGDLNRASDAVPRDEALLAEIQAEIAALEARLEDFDVEIAACSTTCEAELGERVVACVATCAPCGNDPTMWCVGGVEQRFDGNPLFFPLDGVAGDTANRERGRIPLQYGYSNWPWEEDIFPDAELHNFYFTSEVRHWFRYHATTRATLEFLGDDDVWVFVNGHLAVDLGGIHAPALGSVTIDAAGATVTSTISDGLEGSDEETATASVDDFGLVPGNVYQISIFHAERQLYGSSFKLTLAGFEASPSDCTAVCGDGVLSFGEECDDGVNDGGYGECAEGCVLGPFCGDGIVQSEFGEDCDNGPVGGASCPGCRVLKPRVTR